jgi:predicted MFS family arabinose efflux permease
MNRLRFQLPLFTFIRTIFNTAYRMVYPFLAVFARGLGVDLAAMAGAMTARSLIGSFGPFLAAYTDSRGRRVGMLSGLGLFIAGTALVVFWPTFLGFVIAITMGTLGKYNFDPAMQAYLGDRVPYQRRGRALALTELGWSLAFIIGVPLMGFLIARSGWMSPFPLLALLGTLTLAGVLLLIPSDRDGTDEATTLAHNFCTVLTFTPALAGLSVGFLATVANEVVNLIFGVWLEDSFGLQIAALGASAAVIGLSELGGEGLVALFVDRLGKVQAIGLGLLANSLAALALPILGRSEIGALVGLFFFYITFEFTLVSIIPMMTEVMPKARATLMAFNVAVFSLGRAVGAPIGTFLYTWNFWAVVIAAVAFNSISLLALQGVKKHID